MTFVLKVTSQGNPLGDRFVRPPQLVWTPASPEARTFHKAAYDGNIELLESCLEDLPFPIDSLSI